MKSLFPGGPALLALLLSSIPAAPAARAQEASGPLPPPVTRTMYRSHWFEFLNALLEDDERGTARELAEMRRAALRVGVRSLSDFSRAAIFEGRKAERLGLTGRAARAYEAAVELDRSSYDAISARIRFLLRHGSVPQALALFPRAAASLVTSHEPRLALLSAMALWGIFAAAMALLATILILLVRHLPRAGHDVAEFARRRLGPRAAIPLGVLLLVLPLALGLGPIWILLWWGALLCGYANVRERSILVGGLLVFALLPALVAAIGRENIVRRSPLYIAAVDLKEQREDGSAEDGLRQAAAVFAEDADVWFLLGMYAQRAGDNQRAVASFDRAIQADPRDARPFLSRGNVHFEEGDMSQAIRDYEAAAQKDPKAAEAYYNLSIAKADAYDFQAQSQAIDRARRISGRDVSGWSRRDTLSRVVPASYPLSRARHRIEQWNGQPKSRRLPGHAAPQSPLDLLGSPWTLGPLAALGLALAFSSALDRRGTAGECLRCGATFCRFCKRPGDPPLYCTDCVRLHLRKEDAGIGAHVAQAAQVRRRTLWRNRGRRLASLLFPGAHFYFADRPGAGLRTLLAFFFAVAMVVFNERWFDPRQIAGRGPWLVPAALGIGIAAAIWIAGNVAASRDSHGA